jgi:hypothetical protein
MTGRLIALFSGVVVLGAVIAPGSAARADAPAAGRQEDDIEVLARGPVHEAYAAPHEARPLPGPLVATQPPDPVPEEPPDQKPDGAEVRWVPGYWAFDNSEEEYLWVSGFWRDVPPGRQWVPGHWQQVEGGWQWSAGLWAAVGQDEIRYLPAPPPSLDAGPSTPGPEENSVYVPGCWVHREGRYLWRPGFWVGYRPEWVWVPAHYSWTPVGYVFAEGYWDHPLHERGLLFAPVRVERALLARREWTYVPGYAVNGDALLSSLFVSSAGRHYYFGDYYGERDGRRGFVPWVDYHPSRNVDDYNFAYYGRRYHEDPRWQEGLRALYRARRNGDVPRPPRTLVQQTRVVNDITVNRTANVTVTKAINITNVQNVTMIAPLAQVHNTSVTALATLAPPRGGREGAPRVPTHVIKLGAVPEKQRAEERKVLTQGREAALERRRAEAKMLAEGGGPAKLADAPRAVKLVLPRPPALPPPASPAVRVPPLPLPPRHEERPIPKHEPPKQPLPPRKEAAPPPPNKVVSPPPTPRVENKPPPKKEDKPPPPPKKEDKPPPSPKKGGPPPAPSPHKDGTPVAS